MVKHKEVVETIEAASQKAITCIETLMSE